jgi:hypothetical protein
LARRAHRKSYRITSGQAAGAPPLLLFKAGTLTAWMSRYIERNK